MSDPHPAALPVDVLARTCTEKHVRRSGPGGQHRNKVETGVVLTHTPTGITAEASERRSQIENRVVAFRRLRRNLALDVRTASGEAGRSDLWRSRVRHGRLVLAEEHDDYPAMLAEALDVLASLEWDISRAATQLQLTNSQLVRFLKTEPRAFRQLNLERTRRDRSPLQ